MPASTLLASYARRVKKEADDGAERKLVEALSGWLNGSASERQRLGEPHSIVLETDLVASLSARLRTAPWMEVVTAASGADSLAPVGANRAMLLLGLVVRLVHPVDDDVDGAAQPSAHVLQTLVRQVCSTLCAGKRTERAVPSR